MATIYDVNPNDLIEKVAKELEKELKAPEWAPFVKTGVHKERPPTRDDWWYVRAAAVLRTIERMGPIGTSKLRSKYGGKENRGHKTEHTFKGSGSIIRKILQELDQAGLTRQAEVGVHKGRVVTPKGVALMAKVATQLPAHVHHDKALHIDEERRSEHVPHPAQQRPKPQAAAPQAPAGDKPKHEAKPKPQPKKDEQ
jgi:small subunit ribosomal protein S19e